MSYSERREELFTYRSEFWSRCITSIGFWGLILLFFIPPVGLILLAGAALFVGWIIFAYIVFLCTFKYIILL